MSARWLVVLVVSLLGGCGGCGEPDASAEILLGEVIGRVEIDQDIPQPGCKIHVEGTPRAATCDQQGQFTIRQLDAGKWNLQIVANEQDSRIPARKITTASNAGFITDLGAIRIARPGRVGGRVVTPVGTDLPYSVISIPGFAVASAPDPTNNGYLLDRVPAGVHTVVLTTAMGDVEVPDVFVHSDGITTNVDFDLALLQVTSVQVRGSAAVSGRFDRSGIVVDLVDSVTGTIKTTLTTGDDGTFVLPATSGVYLVRAHLPNRALSATIPSVLVAGGRDVQLSSTLVIPEEGDIDGDGIPDDADTDSDGDGEPNATDSFPLDPNEAIDSDGDGVGNNTDLDSNGDMTVDHAVPTPDSDGDGFLDFEDVCPARANPDQLDTDDDGLGNLCDNCPGMANPDQLDTDMDGIGNECETCIAGTPCTPANPCNVGLTACGPNGATCVDSLQPQPNGASCGTNQVCFAGACAPCMNGGTCFTSSGGACVVGVQSCSSGQPECLPTAGLRPDGTPCGTNQVCDSGACVACTEGGACTYAPDECKQGRLSCDTGLPQTCEDSGMNAPDGTSCQGSRYCLSGTCTTCNHGVSCSPAAAPCHLGTIDCSMSGMPQCMDTGANAQDGMPCGGPGLFCASGACIMSPNTLTLVSGGAQTANVGAQLMPIVVRLADGGNNPIVGEPIGVDLAPGASLIVAPGPTDANGQSSFTVRLGPSPGTQTFQALSGMAPALSLPMTATAAPAGSVFTVLNISHMQGTAGVPGAATQALVGTTEGLVAMPDGTLYVLDSWNWYLYKIDPGGQITRIAGGGSATAPPFGDGGPAINATFSSPTELRYRATTNDLLVVDRGRSRIRKINLDTNIISNFAGGGTLPGPGFGDGGSATSADIGPVSMAVMSNGDVYIADSGHNRIRRVDGAGTITTVLQGQTCATGQALGVQNVNATTVLARDTGDSLFVAATLCGDTIGTPNGIVRRAADGTLQHVAGNASGTPGDGAEARGTAFNTISSMAFDPAGNLYVSDGGAHRVRRIDGNTGLTSPVFGTGTAGSAGEYATAATALVTAPLMIAFLGNDLLVADGQSSIRRVAGVARSASPIVMSATTTTLSTEIARLVPMLSARLSETTSGPDYAGLRVEWTNVDPGGVVLQAESITTPSGLAFTSMRPGIAPGAYRVQAQFRTIHGADVTGSPMTYTITANALASGVLATIANLDRVYGAEVTGLSMMAHVGNLDDVVVASDGTIYFTDWQNWRVLKITPTGQLSLIAGGGSTLGDFGPAVNARIQNPAGLFLDELTSTLYIADQSQHRVRAVDLIGGSIMTVAGGATGLMAPYGDGGAATSAQLNAPTQLALGPDGAMYVVDSGHQRIRRFELSPPYTISTFMLASTASCTPSLVFYQCGSPCDIAWSGTDFYVYAQICGTSPAGTTAGILKRDMGGTLSHVLGRFGGMTGEGVAATMAAMTGSGHSLAFAGADIVFSDGHRVRRIAGGNVSTIAGGATPGSSGDYGPATAALLNDPAGVAGHMGRVYVVERGSSCMRVIY
jgi:sugar lactone lactonase YvrE